MKIEDSKFEIGDVLKSKLDNTGLVKFHVVEVTTITCVAGTQFLYGCRIQTQQHKTSAPAFTAHLFPINEIELEKWPEDK